MPVPGGCHKCSEGAVPFGEGAENRPGRFVVEETWSEEELVASLRLSAKADLLADIAEAGVGWLGRESLRLGDRKERAPGLAVES